MTHCRRINEIGSSDLRHRDVRAILTFLTFLICRNFITFKIIPSTGKPDCSTIPYFFQDTRLCDT